LPAQPSEINGPVAQGNSTVRFLSQIGDHGKFRRQATTLSNRLSFLLQSEAQTLSGFCAFRGCHFLPAA